MCSIHLHTTTYSFLRRKTEEMGQFAPQLHFVDTHARGDKKNGYQFEIKPDISVYHESLADTVPTACNSSLLDMHIKFKRLGQDDPFLSPSSGDQDQQSFIGSTLTHKDTLGQIGAYAAAQLASQFRTHCFSLFILCNTARIIQWEREGAIVTEPISYNVGSTLVEFFSRYSQAPPELRGVDTTVSAATEDEATHARTKLNLPNSTPMFKTDIPGSGDGSPFTVIFAHSESSPTSPVCCGTRACAAYDPTGDCNVFFKDSWHIDAIDINPEGQIYSRLNENHVPYVPICLASGDVQCWPKQKTQTFKHSKSPWACRKGVAITSHVHHRLVLDIVGESLTNFASTRQLIQAIHDALLGELFLLL